MAKARGIMAELNVEERSFVRKQRIFNALNQFAWAIQRPASDGQYIALCGGDTGLMARHYGTVQAMNNFFNMFGSPIVGALSDTLGRRQLLALGRCGWVCWFMAIPHFTSLRQRMLGELVCWSVLSTGNWVIYGAQNTDLFGDRPTLSARIAAVDQAVGFTSYAVGALVAEALHQLGVGGRGSNAAPYTFYIAALCNIYSVLLPLSNRETLRKENRRPFELKRANPLSNVLLLLRNGPGLRGLTYACTLFFGCNGCWSTMVPFRMGVLGWSAVDISRMSAFVTPFGALTSNFFVSPFLKKVGNRYEKALRPFAS